MEGTIGEIRMFAGNFAPRSWAFCQGQLLSIAQNTALFSILGTTYGGDGKTTFALPDLRGRIPVGTGTGPGLSPVDLGQVGGSEDAVLNINNMPNHTHAITGTVKLPCNADLNETDSPTGNYPAVSTGLNVYNTVPGNNEFMGNLNVNMTATPTGGNTPFSIQDPSLGMNYIICLEGIFPSRN